MQVPPVHAQPQPVPLLIDKAKKLDHYLKTLSVQQLAKTMHISQKLADTTHVRVADWTTNSDSQRAAVDSFLGDIYSGLQVSDWSAADRDYANKTLYILSGMYGVLRALDGVYPYRLELGYKLPDQKFSNLYTFWGDSVAALLPHDQLVINLAAAEYSKVVIPYLVDRTIITPSFLTTKPQSNEPTFVTVHTKIARGAFAHWLIKRRITSANQLKDFQDLGYRYDPALSSPTAPVFVCTTFGGLGLSVRLKK